MRRVIELDLVTKSDANRRGNSKLAQIIHSEEVAKRRATVTKELVTHFGAQVPPLFVIDGNVSGPNKIAVKLTRIAPGTLDDDNLRGALKAVRDAVAKWIGIDDRNPIAAWSYEQRSAGQHVYRVEIDVVDRAPGNERIVRLAETGSEGRAAASRVKRAVSAQTRKATREATAAQDAAMLTKLRAQARSVLCIRCTAEPGEECRSCPSLSCEKCDYECRLSNVQAGDPCPNGCGALVPEEWGAEIFEYGVHVTRARAAGCPPMPDVAALNRGERPLDTFIETARLASEMAKLGPGGDEDKSPRMLVPCGTCGADIGEPCKAATSETAHGWVSGVHVTRARLAGLAAAGARALAKAPRTGVRKLAPVAVSQPELPVMRAFVTLPWEQTPCDACAWYRCARCGDVLCVTGESEKRCASCGGRVSGPSAGASACGKCNATGRGPLKLRPMPRLDGLFPPPDILMRVPAEHVQRHGTTITLARRRYESAATGVCWVYETKEAKEGRTT